MGWEGADWIHVSGKEPVVGSCEQSNEFSGSVKSEICFYYERFQVLTAASMMFRAVFWDILPCKIIVIRDDGGSTHL
jgi:hypothetical protein